MGLDMFTYRVPAEEVGDKQVDFRLDDYAIERLAAWRKFNHLHGWMWRLYDAKGGTSTIFNCDVVRLMPEDINLLEDAWRGGRLTPTDGFYFGGPDWEPEYDEDLRSFIEEARACHARGEAVLYSSWW